MSFSQIVSSDRDFHLNVKQGAKPIQQYLNLKLYFFNQIHLKQAVKPPMHKQGVTGCGKSRKQKHY